MDARTYNGPNTVINEADMTLSFAGNNFYSTSDTSISINNKHIGASITNSSLRIYEINGNLLLANAAGPAANSR
jgi:hypothetical protein